MVFQTLLLVGVVSAARMQIDEHQYSAGPLEVCCLCFKETGEKTDWKIQTYDDDAAATLQGASFMQCRADQGDGTSQCAAYCTTHGMEMKGCMKTDGMAEWRSVEHWGAKTTSGENSWTCESDSTSDSCGCA